MTKRSATLQRDEKQVSNNAEEFISNGTPYLVEIELTGVVPLLFHAWSTEAVEEKAAAAKNSKTKKTDNVESYVYRTPDGYIGIAGKCLHGALIHAAKFCQDPRSPRKSASDLFKAGIQVLDVVSPIVPKKKTWDYEDKQRVVIQRSAITRTRPALKEGWVVRFNVVVALPEYISPTFLQDVTTKAGLFSGLCDYRPTYGRFRITKFNVKELD